MDGQKLITIAHPEHNGSKFLISGERKLQIYMTGTVLIFSYGHSYEQKSFNHLTLHRLCHVEMCLRAYVDSEDPDHPANLHDHDLHCPVT